MPVLDVVFAGPLPGGNVLEVLIVAVGFTLGILMLDSEVTAAAFLSG